MKTAREILIIGGGIIGLAIAVELKQQGAKVTIISKDYMQAASHAAAGMLAPMAEKMTSAPMLDLCLRSRWLYPEWTQKLEELTGVETSYLPCGILAPVYSQPDLHTNQDNVIWLDQQTININQD
jgi:thiazole synthase